MPAPHPAPARLVAPLAAALALGLGLGTSAPSRAQALPGIDDYARAIAALTARRWEGQRVPFPAEDSRPSLPLAARDPFAPLAVHAPAGTDGATIATALRGARRMLDALADRGYPRPRGDGDLGGGPELDLYLDPSPEPATRDAVYRTISDGPAIGFLDGILAHVVLDGSLAGARLEACAGEAVADALLAQLDPAESPSTRRSLAAALAYAQTGLVDGCTDDALVAQRTPALGLLSPESPRASAALFFAFLARRGDRGDGSYLRETFTMARQRTWEGDELRGSPDVFEAIATSARLVDTSLDRYLLDFAALRLGLATPARDRDAWIAGMPRLPSDGQVPIAFEARFSALPIRTAPHAPAIEPTGSAYARIDVDAETTDHLRVFLRGESFTRWSLVAIALDSTGREKTRVEAPIRDREPDAYTTVELPGVRTVYLIVTNLGPERADPDRPTTGARTFHLLVDHAAD